MLVYLSGPMDAVPRNHSTGWRKYVSDIFVNNGINCFCPVGAMTPGPDPAITVPITSHKIMEIGTYVAVHCDVMLSYLPSDVLTVGTSCEIDRRRQTNGGPTVVVCDKSMLWLNGCDVVPNLDLGVDRVLQLHRQWLKVVKAGRRQGELHEQRWWQLIEEQGE